MFPTTYPPIEYPRNFYLSPFCDSPFINIIHSPPDPRKSSGKYCVLYIVLNKTHRNRIKPTAPYLG